MKGKANKTDDWGFLVERAKSTTSIFPRLTEACETAIKSMWLMENKITEIAKTEGTQLPPLDTFALTHFRRNTVYLHSSYILAAMGFVSPSMNLQRTIYETILRGYFFIVNPEEASLYYDSLGTDTSEAFLKTREYYRHSYLSRRLYKAETQKAEKKFYEMLCTAAHAEIRGLFLDFPAYNKREIEDRLKIVLMLAYGSIQMFAEMFLDRFNKALQELVKIALQETVTAVGNLSPLIEPDKENYTAKIILKKGNFLQVL